MAKRERYWVHSDPTGPSVGDAEVIDPDKSPCPGDCNRAHRSDQKLGGARGVKPVPGAPVWCRPCQTTIRDALSTLPGLAADCAAMPDGRLAQTADLEGRFATRDGSPSGSPAWDAADEIVRWALSWEDALRSHLRHSTDNGRIRRLAVRRTGRLEVAADGTVNREPDDGRVIAVGPILWDPDARRTLTAAVRYLDTWHTAWLSSPMAVDAGRETLSLARRAAAATGRDRVVHHLPLPCLRCDARALRREDGSETVFCRSCDARWTADDYDRLAYAFADGERRFGKVK